MTMTEDEAKAVLDELVAKDEKGRKVILLYNLDAARLSCR